MQTLFHLRLPFVVLFFAFTVWMFFRMVLRGGKSPWQ
jgi:hypothetical protein